MDAIKLYLRAIKDIPLLTAEEERSLAIDVTKNTIDYAKKFEAGAVILHTGRVQIKDRTRDLAALAGDKEKFEILRSQMIRERQDKKNGYLDNVMKSLDELAPYAKERGIFLGIENRFYYRELPLIEELEAIFNNFKTSTLCYWHDIGHAEVFDRLGITSHIDFLDKFSKRLIGVHLHDIIGLINDHRLPGIGNVDFKILKPYLGKKTIKVIEIHQPASAEQIRESVKYLTDIYG